MGEIIVGKRVVDRHVEEMVEAISGANSQLAGNTDPDSVLDWYAWRPGRSLISTSLDDSSNSGICIVVVDIGLVAALVICDGNGGIWGGTHRVLDVVGYTGKLMLAYKGNHSSNKTYSGRW